MFSRILILAFVVSVLEASHHSIESMDFEIIGGDKTTTGEGIKKPLSSSSSDSDVDEEVERLTLENQKLVAESKAFKEKAEYLAKLLEEARAAKIDSYEVLLDAHDILLGENDKLNILVKELEFKLNQGNLFCKEIEFKNAKLEKEMLKLNESKLADTEVFKGQIKLKEEQHTLELKKAEEDLKSLEVQHGLALKKLNEDIAELKKTTEGLQNKNLVLDEENQKRDIEFKKILFEKERSFKDVVVQHTKLGGENKNLQTQLDRFVEMESKLSSYEVYSVTRLCSGQSTESLRNSFAASPWLLTGEQRYAIANHKGTENSANRSVNVVKISNLSDFLLKK